MKTRICILYSLIFLLVLSNISLAQSEKNAIRALKKLEAKCQVGVSYRDYITALGDTKFEVNMFLESSKAAKNPELAASIKKAMIHYEMAGKVLTYNSSLPGGGGFFFLIPGPMDVGYEFGKAILKSYPKANKNIENGGALTGEGSPRGVIDVSALVQIIWQEASAELKKASFILSE